jgi:ArsR family transcriptional regulator
MESTNVVAALSALAQETRLEIYRLLVRAGPSGLAAGRIGEALDLPLATLSFHLAQLKHAGLATYRRDGRSIIYAANYPAMNGLLAYLSENCCADDGEGAACAVGCAPSAAKSSREGASHETTARARHR